MCTFATTNTFSTYVHGTKARSLYNDSASSLGTYDKKPVFNEGGGSVKNMQQFIR
jgi:hypothetical protein